MEKTGLVFSGGGAKGAYEIGVWMALRDMEIEPEICGVSGTSIGAINLALFAQGDLELARSIWMNLSKKDVVQFDLKKAAAILGAAAMVYFKPEATRYLTKFLSPDIILHRGAFSQSTLRRVFNDHINPKAFFLPKRELFVCCCIAGKRKPVYFQLLAETPEHLASVLLASCALPVAFDAIKIGNEKYIDGGLADNVPVSPLYDRGYRRLIVVDLSPKPKPLDYPGASVWQIAPAEVPKGHQETLEFNPQKMFNRMLEGYSDTLATLRDFPAQHELNLFEARGESRALAVGTAMELQNDLDLTVNGLEVRTQADGTSYLYADVIFSLSDRWQYGDSCLVVANILTVLLPDGSRRFADPSAPGDRVYPFPFLASKGNTYQGWMAFRLPPDENDFALCVQDWFNNAPCGTSYYLDCHTG